MTSPAVIRRLQDEVGLLVARHAQRGTRPTFERYAADPAAFIREVLHEEPLPEQVRIADTVRDQTFVVVRSCNGFGKDWIAARIALWWTYARGGFVLITGPTERQVRHVAMGEVARAFGRTKTLPGTLFELALRLDRTSQAGILGFTSTEVSRLTGFHAPKLLVILTEAQGLEPAVWEGCLSCATGEESKVLAVGNPLAPSGKFFEVSRSDRWHAIRLQAADHPNVQEGREIVPGAVTQKFVETMAAEFGPGSGVYRARVEGEFPDEADDALIPRSWLDAAAERWERETLEAKARAQSHVAAVDVARYGADATCLIVRQGPVVRDIITWGQLSTMETCGRVTVELARLGLDPHLGHPRWEWVPGAEAKVPASGGPGQVHLRVDEIGIGSGVLDRFRELGYTVESFHSGRAPSEGGRDKFLNARAEAFWGLRRLLEQGHIALPRDLRLWDELSALRWKVNSTGKIAIEPKEDTRLRLGRSPDRADALMMAFAGMYRPAGEAWRTVLVRYV
jgi:hypothetical protein